MAKPQFIQLGRSVQIPILYEDRSVMALDKPAGWLLVPSHWDRTARNLQLAIDSSIRGKDFWAKSRNLRFLRFVHRLDAETTGVLLFCKSPGGVPVYSKLFESRQMKKQYLAVVEGCPEREEWTVSAPLGPDSSNSGKMRVDNKLGREAVTEFSICSRNNARALIVAKPITGRTHQIRVHLAISKLPVLGDTLYGAGKPVSKAFPLALRSAKLEYRDPFGGRTVRIRAEMGEFCRTFGFEDMIEKGGL